MGKAAELVRAGKAERFGFITTNSIHQTFNRRVIEKHLSDEKNPLSLAYAIPDHPWVDTVDGAAVRIAMTVAGRGKVVGELNRVTRETSIEDGENSVDLHTTLGNIAATLKIGADLSSTVPLRSQSKLAGMGIALHGSGFIVEGSVAESLAASGPTVIKSYIGGSELLRQRSNRFVIDFSFMDDSTARDSNTAAYQHVLNHVKPERDQNRRKALKENWWRFGWERPVLRAALADIDRFIATTETAKNRVFQFVSTDILPDHMIVSIAVQDALYLGILSSSIHLFWSLQQGGTLEDRPRYNKTRCFDTFPFPDLTDKPDLQFRLRQLGEDLDAHRKRQQAAHPDLTMTGMYNVLEKLRSGEPLTDKQRKIHDQGLVSVLRQIHDDIDTATLEAYGWENLVEAASSRFSPATQSKRQDAASTEPLADRLATDDETSQQLEQELLQRLVDLNHERAAEEAEGKIRWLRPEYQDPDYQESEDRGQASGEQPELAGTEVQPTTGKPITEEMPWPKDLPAQVALIRRLSAQSAPTVEAITPLLKGRNTAKRKEQIAAILETLESLGWG